MPHPVIDVASLLAIEPMYGHNQHFITKESLMPEPKVLTVQSLLNELNALVKKHPKAAQYQIAEGTYDDWSCSCQMMYSGCKEVVVSKRPKDKGFTQGVAPELTSKRVVFIR